jgi:hypothetical protein
LFGNLRSAARHAPKASARPLFGFDCIREAHQECPGVAISNSRLVSADAETVAFRWKDFPVFRRAILTP